MPWLMLRLTLGNRVTPRPDGGTTSIKSSCRWSGAAWAREQRHKWLSSEQIVESAAMVRPSVARSVDRSCISNGGTCIQRRVRSRKRTLAQTARPPTGSAFAQTDLRGDRRRSARGRRDRRACNSCNYFRNYFFSETSRATKARCTTHTHTHASTSVKGQRSYSKFGFRACRELAPPHAEPCA